MLPRQHRLTRPADYRAVLRGGDGRRRRRAGTDLLVVHVAVPTGIPTDGPPDDHRPTRPPRVGLVVSKAVGGSVVRHRVQRRLRHLLRSHLGALPSGADVVVRAQPSSAQASSAQLDAALELALSRAGVGAAR
ncbi:ribonuclease P protein component [Ornithinimicrobium cerasi]|uniref:Ribonuclease P protein component n=1 Tax=Ornithinimicrobium cerasi TaxID=2248773 RepID=A0A285VVZ0_9MICO|nr:ribonuclease P protein component [Ornithinimicrobium cerasi]SOC58260.1 ribonuclease P protein component [Ornithinimicrobium cerasi]